jgi:hypothetical protein
MREISALDPKMGILLIELPHCDSTTPQALCPFILKALRTSFASLQIQCFIFVSHSYGTFLVAYLPQTNTNTSTNLDPDRPEEGLI